MQSRQTSIPGSNLQERHPNRPVHHRHPLERHDGEGIRRRHAHQYGYEGLSAPDHPLSKFTGALLIWTISFWLCFFITLGYTLYYFPEGTTENLSLSIDWPLSVRYPLDRRSAARSCSVQKRLRTAVVHRRLPDGAVFMESLPGSSQIGIH